MKKGEVIITEKTRGNIRRGLEQALHFSATITGKLKEEKELQELIERAVAKVAETQGE